MKYYSAIKRHELSTMQKRMTHKCMLLRKKYFSCYYFGEKYFRGKGPFSTPHIKAVYHQHVGIDLDHLAKVVFVRFLHWKVTLSPPLPSCRLWKEVALCSPCLRCEELGSISLRVGKTNGYPWISFQYLSIFSFGGPIFGFISNQKNNSVMW